MLKEIISEEICPQCNGKLNISGTYRMRFFVHTCFKCKKTFICEEALKGVTQ